MANLAKPPDSAGSPDESQPPETPEDETLFERRMRIVQMRNAGGTFSSIADRLGMSQSAVRKDFNAGLREYMKSSIDDRVARQISVIWDVIRANYLKMTGGDIDAAKMILSSLERESKLLGLDAPTRVNLGISDVEYAEKTAALIRELGAVVPEELAALMPGAGIRLDPVEPPEEQPAVIDGEVVEILQSADTENTKVAGESTFVGNLQSEVPADDARADAPAEKKHAFYSKKAPADAEHEPDGPVDEPADEIPPEDPPAADDGWSNI